MLGRVDRHVAELQAFADARRPDPTQLRADAGHELDHRVGLHDIIVCPGFEAPHPVDFLGARRDHDDGNSARLRGGLEATTDLDARHLGEHPVEQDQVRGVLARKVDGCIAGRGLAHLVAFRLEVVDQDLAL